jgi:hypothetical protein
MNRIYFRSLESALVLLDRYKYTIQVISNTEIKYGQYISLNTTMLSLVLSVIDLTELQIHNILANVRSVNSQTYTCSVN